MRGGYRVGSGPKKGAKYRPRTSKNVPEAEWTPEEKEDLRLLLSFGDRLKDGGQLTRTEMKQLEEIGERLGKLTLAEKRLLESFR